MAEHTQNYTLGRGQLFFEQFKPGSRTPINGERYLGNSPEISATVDNTTLDHWSSDYGVKEKDESITLQNEETGSFTLDDISQENLALFFLGEVVNLVEMAQTGFSETFTIGRNRYYQLGTRLSDNNSGARFIDNVVVTVAGNQIALADNIEVNLEKGRLYVEPTADTDLMPEGAQMMVTYDKDAQSRPMVITKGTQIRGRLRYIADNPAGENLDHYWPDIRLTANGDYAFKGDDWQTMSFNFEALRRGFSVPRHIIDAPAKRIEVEPAAPADNGAGS